jgi:FHS family L-fucose permease-like MFS transporter
MHTTAPITEKRFALPLLLVTSLFFLWAIGVNLNDILIQHLKKAFGLSDFRSSLIQTAFFGGYFLAALPAGWLMQRIGYKKGILIGLLTCATGAFLFIPAASVGLYAFFLFALFTMACGQSFLEVAANPYVTVLGPGESSERRLNLAQFFNSVGAVVIALVGARFILSGIEHTSAEIAAMTPAQVWQYRAFEASMVKKPYLIIAGIFLLVALLIYLTKLPEISAEDGTKESTTDAKLSGLWAYPHLLKGVVGQFFYVGAQVGVASFIIRFVEHTLPGTHEKVAAHYLQIHLFGFMVGRLVGSTVMKYVSAPKLLRIFAGSSVLCVTIALLASGYVSVWAVVLLGFFHSIMFPTIFALSLKNLCPYTKLASSFVVMAIIGGAVCPAIMGRISDAWNIQMAFVVPLICHVYVLYFAVRGYKPAVAADSSALQIAASEAE